MRRHLPGDITKRLPWEYVLFTEFEKARHKARYIQTRIDRLSKMRKFGGALLDVTSIAQFLTHEQRVDGVQIVIWQDFQAHVAVFLVKAQGCEVVHGRFQ